MTRSSAHLREARRLLKKPAGKFIEIDLGRTNAPSWMTRAYQNNHYVVMIDDNAQTTAGKVTKAMIQRHDDAPIHSWAELQSIKNLIFGNDTIAIEYYPKQSELCDVANIYWLWIYPDGVLPLPLNVK